MSTEDEGGVSSIGSWCSIMGLSFGLGLKAWAMLLRDIEEILDILFMSRLRFESLFSSLVPSGVVAPLGALSLMVRGTSASLVVRLDLERILAKESRRLVGDVVGDASPLRSVLEDDPERAEEYRAYLGRGGISGESGGGPIG